MPNTNNKHTVFQNFTLLADQAFPDVVGTKADGAGKLLGWVHFTKGGFWRGCAVLRSGSVSTGFPTREEAETFVRTNAFV